MRISDWSSDVCSSDLFECVALRHPAAAGMTRWPAETPAERATWGLPPPTAETCPEATERRPRGAFFIARMNSGYPTGAAAAAMAHRQNLDVFAAPACGGRRSKQRREGGESDRQCRPR